ncbi:hypothetical protein SLE2022_242060 [Rubroshorea leprosula]
MGIATHPLLLSLTLKSRVLGDEQVLKARRKLKVMKRKVVKCRRSRRVLKKRRACVEGTRRPASTIERKIRTLKKLIPNSEGMELDGLFRETAEYIHSLEMRVKVMQIMVGVLTGSKDE